MNSTALSRRRTPGGLRAAARALCLVLCALAAVAAAAQRVEMKLLEYNVENLFDLRHDAGCNDADFLPDGACAWDSLRYRKKLAGLARVIAAAGGERPADLVALCEVENDSVLRDLTRRTRLMRLGYDFIATESRDGRGMDVALLYQPARFQPIAVDTLRLGYTAGRERPTRDILHVAGRIPTGDTLDVVVAHWPSRRGGAERTAPYRFRAAQRIACLADSLRCLRRNFLMIVAGDFNDEPADRSLCEGLRALPISKCQTLWENENLPAASCAFVNLSAELTADDGRVRGTYKYKGLWNRLDHILLNKEAFRRKGKPHMGHCACEILALPFLLQEVKGRYNEVTPYRTYLGRFYQGGVSDHLPLLLTFELLGE